MNCHKYVFITLTDKSMFITLTDRSDPKGIFSFYAFIINNKIILYLYFVSKHSQAPSIGYSSLL